MRNTGVAARPWLVVISLTVTFPLAVTLAASGALAQASQATFDFEEECLDLDTGEVDDSCSPMDADETWDVLVSYHSDRSVHAVVLQNQDNQVEIAHLEGRSFEDVTSDDIAGAPFTSELVDEPFDSGRVILVRTDTGDVYKLGNVSEGETSATFDHELL